MGCDRSSAAAHQPGKRRVDDRRVLSGIVHVLKSGCRWRNCPAAYGPRTTIYNRFNRWSQRGIWQQIFVALACAEPNTVVAIDSTSVKRQRTAAGGKGGLQPTPSAIPEVVPTPRSMLQPTTRADPSR
jgi:transposase